MVLDELPHEATPEFTSGCDNDPNGTPWCELGTIASGASAEYSIAVELVRSTTTIVNFVNATSDTTDPKPENNSVYEETEIVAIPIPAIDHMGLLLLALLMGCVGVIVLKTR
jgi:hypothetical protein